MSLFQFLAERPGRVVSRQELMDSVWEGRIVGEDALNNCVKKLRRLLDDDPKNPEVIETIKNFLFLIIRSSSTGESHFKKSSRLASHRRDINR